MAFLQLSLIIALEMVLTTTGELVLQDMQQVEVCATGQAALIQKATTLRSSVSVLPEKSSSASVDAGPSLLQFTIIPPSDGLQNLMESDVDEQQAHDAPSDSGVWDELEDMSLPDLQQATFEAPPRLLKEAAAQTSTGQRSAPACGVLWFYHIGKCAGTSAYSWLRQLKEIGGIQELLDLSATPSKWEIDFNAFDRKLYQSIDKNAGKVIAVHHHHNGPGLYGWMQNYQKRLKDILNARGCSLVKWTLLRRPELRLISHVNFVMQILGVQTKDKASHNQFFRKVLSASDATKGDDQFVNQYDNHQIRYLLNNFGRTGGFPMPFGGPNHDGALNAAVQILDSFDVVGVVEKVDNSIAKLTQLLGLPALPFPRTNVRRAEFQSHDKTPFPDDVQLLMQERTAFEKKLWSLYAPPGA